ncbi:galactose-3-O-sulfotransferase 2-like isoform X2 [Pyxicephalus adspersus]
MTKRFLCYLKTLGAILLAGCMMFLAFRILDFPMKNRFMYKMDDAHGTLVNEHAEKSRESCQSKRNIFFLKTHKTASSTIINILFRYGEFHNLTFAFPVRSSLYSYPNFFSASYVDGFSVDGNKTFNIMCHHMRFMLTEVKKVMPNDTFYFTVMRNPISLFESSFSYWRKNTPFVKAKNLEDFLNNSSAYYDAVTQNRHLVKNLMAFDLGFDPKENKTINKIQFMLNLTDTIFDLVLITEYFDESLILLKEALCWSFDDVLSFPLNRRSNNTMKTLTLETQEKIKRWNSLDWQLYVHFNNSFWELVEKFGRERMQHEIGILQMKRAEMEKTCLQGEVAPSQLKDKSMIPYQSGIATILGYNLKPGLTTPYQLLCRRLVTPELQYNSLLHDKQKIM